MMIKIDYNVWIKIKIKERSLVVSLTVFELTVSPSPRDFMKT